MTPNSEQIRWMILGLVKEYGHVTFADISKRISSENGNVTMRHPEHESIIFWENLSENVVKALEDLVRQKQIFMAPATQFTYLADGLVSTLPLATSARDYTKPHWLPICFHHTKS